MDRPARSAVIGGAFRTAGRIALALSCLWGGTSIASGLSDLEERIHDQKQELARMRAELEEGRRKLKELGDRARSEEVGLQQVESNLRLGEKILQRLDSTESLYKDLVSKSESEVRTTTSTWQERRALLSHRIRQMYVKGTPDPVSSLVFQSEGGWARVVAEFRSVARADRNLMDLVKARRAVATRELASHRQRVAGLEEIAQQKKRDLEGLEQERDSKAGSLAQLRQGEEKERRRLADLEASQKVLTQLLTDLEQRRERLKEERRKAEEEARRQAEAHRIAEEKRRKEAAKRKKEGKPPPPPIKEAAKPPPPPPEDKALSGPAPARKGLCWPVQGTVLSRFGLERNAILGTVTRNLGIEIAGKAGQSVLAAAPGRVAAITQLPGRGTTVILEHPGGYFSVYGQLSKTRVKEGNAVSSCTEVGTLAPDDPPRVYFEYRHNLKAEDPLEWLTR
ncbi:MAG TPA: peptidoglycan DD-metalloendopeptidase family protein [Fibrobacteria bacterium]|nr:peptidoglycan DD-metalloendopeptidase family protein [Fibrobacteria bacterium]HOX50267.1 peptidoglycan DD-metalloendopeptidase family protein [Fibrobacteria bacterium]